MTTGKHMNTEIMRSITALDQLIERGEVAIAKKSKPLRVPSIEVGEDWIPDGHMVISEEQYAVFRDPKNPALQVALHPRSYLSRFLHLYEGQAYEFGMAGDFPLADAQQTAKTAAAVATLEGNCQDKRGVREAITHLETLLDYVGRLQRILVFGHFLGTDPRTACQPTSA